MRIVSLLPSATEICFALGLGDMVVGVTHECDYPYEALSKPKITSSKSHDGLSSREIDTLVRSQLDSSGSIYGLDIEKLEELKPDLILTQRLCTVCAVSIEQVQEVAANLSSKPQVVNLEPRTMGEVFQSFKKVAQVCDRSVESAPIIAEMEARYRNVGHLIRRLRLPTPKVMLLEWIEPPFASGHWIPEIVSKAGGENSISFKERPSREISWKQVIESHVDFLVFAACGMGVGWQKKEIEIILAQHGLTGLTRESSGTPKMWICDGSQYFSRPGPRLVETTELLATILHPELLGEFGSKFRAGMDFERI
jgi:iron complex transport system substrate-binding protein